MREITFSIRIPAGDRRHWVDEDDIRVVLGRLPDEVKARVRGVHLNDEMGRRKVLGYTNRGRHDVALCAQPPRLSLFHALKDTKSTPETFGAIRGAQWPALAVRRFMLYHVLLHEIGHLQEIHPKLRHERRRFAMEPKAESFANAWRARLWAQPFDHPDAVHNPPSADEIAALASFPEANAEYKRGLAAQHADDDTAARSHFSRAVELFPSHALALTDLAMLVIDGRHARERFEEAAGLLHRAVRADPTNVEASFRLAWALGHLGQREAWRPHFARAVRLGSPSDRALAGFADALADWGLFEESERLFLRVIAKGTERPRALLDYARAIWDVAPATEENTARALSIFEQAIAADPENARAHDHFGRVLATLPGENARALHHLREALRLDPARTRAAQLIEKLEAGRAEEPTKRLDGAPVI